MAILAQLFWECIGEFRTWCRGRRALTHWIRSEIYHTSPHLPHCSLELYWLLWIGSLEGNRRQKSKGKTCLQLMMQQVSRLESEGPTCSVGACCVNLSRWHTTQLPGHLPFLGAQCNIDKTVHKKHKVANMVWDFSTGLHGLQTMLNWVFPHQVVYFSEVPL